MGEFASTNLINLEKVKCPFTITIKSKTKKIQQVKDVINIITKNGRDKRNCKIKDRFN